MKAKHGVVVFGWAGATRRQMGHVERLHVQAGREVQVVTPHIPANLVRPSGFARDGRQTAETIARALRGDWSAHVFSNAGLWTWDATVVALRDRHPEVFARAAAVIVDSAPGFDEHLEPDFVARHSAMAMMPMLLAALGRRPRLRHPLLTPPLEAAIGVWQRLARRQVQRLARPLKRLPESTSHLPHLFLYGEGDVLVPSRLVERFAEQMQTAGAPVRRHRFEGSGHVQHLLRHRRTYASLVDDHLTRASARAI